MPKVTTRNSRKLQAKPFESCEFCSEVFTEQRAKLQHVEECAKRGYIENNNELDESPKENRRPIYNPPTVPTAKPSEIKTDESIYDFQEVDDETNPNTDYGDAPCEEDESTIDNNRKCKYCHQIFDSPLEQLRHSRDCQSHNGSRRILPTEEVEQYFDNPNRSYCPICEKPIKTRNFRSVFIKHLLVHTTGLTHECKVCKKKFRRRDHMRAHEKRHVV